MKILLRVFAVFLLALSSTAQDLQQDLIYRQGEVPNLESLIEHWGTPQAKGIQIRRRASLAVTFEFDSAALTDDAKSAIDVVAQALNSKAVRRKPFEIYGHTDVSGSEAYNQRLSERRAEAVVRYLVDVHGVEASRLSAVGLGETALLDQANGANPENRRVEFITSG